MDKFISEDDLKSFDGWLRYQAVDATAITPGELATWRRIFEDARQRSAVNPEMGLMKLQPILREYQYAVVVNRKLPRQGDSFNRELPASSWARYLAGGNPANASWGRSSL